MSFEGDASRRHPRRAHTDIIEFCLNPTDITTTLQGTLVDISDSGMGLYSFQPLFAGQHITVRSTLPVPYQKAIVRWVKKYSEDLYRVGLMFIE
jgi:c-di-GMP-binding flagellar brake protein YcgR